MDPTVVVVVQEATDFQMELNRDLIQDLLAPLGASALTISASPFPIAVGGGGPGSTPWLQLIGGNKVQFKFFNYFCWRRRRQWFSKYTCSTGGSGGSGGGGGQSDTTNPNYPGGCSQGTGNTPSVSPPQGNPGGKGSSHCTKMVVLVVV